MRIEHIDQVLPHVEGRPDFVVARRDGYTAIDYMFADATTFDDPVRLECRGIKFAPDGRILARPFGKFFNIGEKEHTQPHLLDFGQPHTITEKLDGSMIHPAIVEGRVVFMTRMGRSDHARTAERHLTPELDAQCRHALETGLTPIFEWTAPDNRIVVRYDQSTLTLLAMRRTVDGTYAEPAVLDAWAKKAGVSVVKQLSSEWKDGPGFVEFARAVTGSEGFVVRFADGLWVKAKGEDYVIKHRAKDSISLEKNALAIILSNSVDDVLPLLTEADASDIRQFQAGVLAGVAESARELETLVSRGAHLDQKTFAVEHLKGEEGLIRSMAFTVRAGKPAIEVVRDAILKNTGSRTRVESVRPLFKATWNEAAHQSEAA